MQNTKLRNERPTVDHQSGQLSAAETRPKIKPNHKIQTRLTPNNVKDFSFETTVINSTC